MQMSQIYGGLPAEFASPQKAAEHIAALSTVAERLAYFDRIPAHYQKMIATLAVMAIAANIIGIDDKERRREALARVPDDWRKDVKSHVARIWPRREKFLAEARA